MSSTEGLNTTVAYNRYQPLLDGLIDAAVIVDRDLKPRAWNAAYAHAVGVRGRRLAKLSSAPGICCHNLFAIELCHKDCLASRCFRTNRFVRMDEIHGGSQIVAGPEDGIVGRMPKRNSTLIVSAMPLPDEKGEAVFVLEVYRDVTTEARFQQRYKEMLAQERHRTEDLALQVRLRTAELEQSLEKLRATRAQLIRSEKLSSLGQLVAGIAHEINNPVNFIYGNIEFLHSYVVKFIEHINSIEAMLTSPKQQAKIKELKQAIEFDYLVEDTKQLLNSVSNGAERVTSIIRDLRSFIRGGSEVIREPVNIENCLDTTINLVKHQARGRINIVQQYRLGLPIVIGNEGQLNQVFMNLIVNAIQAIDKKGTVTIAAKLHDNGINIDVSDDGVGISESDQLKIFDPFFTTKPVGQGTGLGLSISYSVIDAHGGRLAVRSKLGKGSTFTVWLPAQANQMT